MAIINLILLVAVGLVFCVVNSIDANPAFTNFNISLPTAESSIKTSMIKPSKHHLKILYEAMCPDSEQFMAQLGPVYEALKDYLELEFVPFGLTKLFCKHIINGKCERPNFTCKHGPAGCKANRQHDCALQYSESQEKQMKFIMCTMGSYKSTVDKCLLLLDYSIYDVDICMTFDEGTELQLKSFEKTKEFMPITTLPVIILDDFYSEENEDAALRDFRTFACNQFVNKFQIFNMTNAPQICLTSDIFPSLVN